VEASATAPAKRLRRQLRNIEAMFEDQLLGTCPGCQAPVAPDSHAFRFRSQWYHLSCALREREPEHAYAPACSGARQ
jgi:hypothetical protein